MQWQKKVWFFDIMYRLEMKRIAIKFSTIYQNKLGGQGVQAVVSMNKISLNHMVI